jgi:branched-chain amino acid transport system permease protein
MQQFLALSVAGIATYGCVYALTALGLVVTYTTSGIFNFAQGAVGMIGAFLYWQFEGHFGWPSWAAFILVAFVISPLGGALIERGLMRRLSNASLEAKLTVTVGLLLFFLAIANTAWNPQTARVVPQFFNGDQVSVGGVVLTYHQLIVVAVAILVAIGLRLFFYLTRTGIATRAVVDDRELTALTGAVPSRYSMLGWAMGSSLASIAGILLAPTVNLDINTLTLLVINGYAAAMVGRLRSLPLTFLGAIVLGLLQSYAIGYLPVGDFWTSFGQIIPMLYLFLVIILLPQSRATITRQVRLRAPRVASMKESLVTTGVFIILAIIASQVLSSGNLNYADRGVSIGIIMLSLVLLTGYGGQVSLCQLTFAGLGAYAMGKVGGTGGSTLGLLAAIGLSAAVGTIVALPALRLRGLYLALATLAFAYGMDNAFFSSTKFFGSSDSLNVARPHIPGISFNSNRTYFVALCIVFGAAGIGLLALRRSAFGRRLLAISDSPAACLTLGIDMTRSKLLVFTISSGLAGLGGALYGGAQGAIGPNDFAFLLSLTLLLLAVVWGIRTIGGMFIGGLALALGPVLQSHLSKPRDIVQLLVGLAAIGISQNPEGTFGGNTPLQKWRDRQGQVPDVVVPGEAVTEGSLSGVGH